MLKRKILLDGEHILEHSEDAEADSGTDDLKAVNGQGHERRLLHRKKVEGM